MTDREDKEKGIAGMMHDGDSSSYKALYCTYSGWLTGVCSRYLSDSDDVKDVLHDSFLTIFDAIRTFEYRGPGSLKAWLTRIAVNESLKFLRQRYRQEFLPLSMEMPIQADSTDDPRIDGISMETLHRLIRELPPGYRTVFNLYVFEGKSHKEIAELLNIKEASSASQFHRAKAMLAEKIKNHQSNNPGL